MSSAKLPPQIDEALSRYVANEATDADKALIREWFPTHEETLEWPGTEADLEQRLALLRSRMEEITAAPEAPKRIHVLRSKWLRYAAILIPVIGVTIFMLLRNTPVAPPPSTILADIRPGGNKATLTLGDGRTITLDDARVGNLAQQGNTKILKTDSGALTYEGSKGTDQVMYNTIHTPVSAQFQITLSDGTKVWLNAMSSIRFPTAFGSNRTVEMTGEVYFEVAASSEQPFFVKTPQAQIEVLGTRFNVNAYANEPMMKTSLLSGKIKIGNTILAPGQAFMRGLVINTNIAQDLAWKNGVFNFQHTRLDKAMRELERWYDIKVQYPEELANVEFWGEMGKNLTLQQVLKGLDGMEGMHFELKGKQLTIRK